MNKKSIAVIFGGVSSEHDVSLVSATNIINCLSKDKYDVHMIGITKDGKWYLYTGNVSNIKDDKWIDDSCCVSASILPDRAHRGITVFYPDGIKTIDVDCVFPVLHGKNGEDGTIQGLFELCSLPFVGCDMLSSAVSMDKSMTNLIMDYADIPQAKWLSTTKYEYEKNSDAFLDKAIDYLSLPIFVKPACTGSSVGITKATDREMLKKAMDVAFSQDRKAVLEETIVGREIECAVLGNDEPVAAVPCEILSCNDFYDYDAKYILDGTRTVLPAKLGEENTEKLRELAVKVYKTLGCSGMTRVDFFASADGGRFWFNEVNTIPGFTPISMYPKMFEACGKTTPELVDELIELAIERCR